MKKILVILAISLAYNSSFAQGVHGTGDGKREVNNEEGQNKQNTLSANDFIDTEMLIEEDYVAFSNLPQAKKALYAVLTNAAGEYLRQARISPFQNTMSIKRLGHGLYFVTILYKNHGKKTFKLNL